MEIIHDFSSIPLTSAEVGYMWMTYLLNSKSKHILKYAVQTCADPNIKEILNSAFEVSDKNIKGVTEIFNSVNHPVPYGFSDYDIKLDSPKLFSDKLMLHILKLYLAVGITQYGFALSLAAREDAKKFFYHSMNSSISLLMDIDKVALGKGIFMRTPNIPIPKKVEIAEDKSIMGRFIGKKRPMNAIEASNIFNTSLSNYIIKATIMGIAQTMKDEIIRDFLHKAISVLKEHTEELNAKLQKENLLVPTNLNSELTDCTESPFSDKLSLFFAFSTLGDLISTYAVTMVNVQRKDLMLRLTELNTEVRLLVKDAADIMIKRGWFEEMPKNVDRYDIIDSNESQE